MRIEDFEVKKAGKDKCVVTKYHGSAEELQIPEKIGDFTPVEIGPQLVRKTAKIRKLSLPTAIEAIDSGLFPLLRNLEEVCSSGKRFISKDGVLYDKQMKTLLLYPAKKPDRDFFCPETVTAIGENAFASGSLMEVFHAPDRISSFPVLPSWLPHLRAFTGKAADDGVLYDGRKLLFYPPLREGSSFSIPQGTEKIEVREEPLFPPSVRSIHVPASLKEGLVENARDAEEIEADSANKVYATLSGVVFSKTAKMLMMYPRRRKGDVYFIPAGTAGIAGKAFSGASLKALILPNGISAIEGEAFEDASVAVMTLPSTLTSLDIMAFHGIKDVEEVHVEMVSIPDVFMQGSVLRHAIRYAEHI